MNNSRKLRSIIFVGVLFLITFSMAENVSWSKEMVKSSSNTNNHHQFTIQEIRDQNQKVYKRHERLYFFWSGVTTLANSVLLLSLFRFIHSTLLRQYIIFIIVVFGLNAIVQILTTFPHLYM